MSYMDVYHRYIQGVQLASPWYLLLLIPLVLLLWWAARRPLPTVKVPWLKPFAVASQKTGGFRWSVIPMWLIAIGLMLLIVALARPRKGIEQLKQRAEGIDIMLALDLSGSMKAIDIPNHVSNIDAALRGVQAGKYRERVRVAIKEIETFIDKRPNDRIGLVVFAEKPFLVCPPTLDHQFLLSSLESLDAGVIGNMTGIASPISSAVQRLKDTDSKRRVLVLFTDGSNNVNARISPIQAAKLAKNYNVVVYTVGIGSGNAIISGHNLFGQESWQPYRGEFDKDLLQKIAKETDGKYFEAEDADRLKEVMREIDHLEKTSVEQPRFVDYRELGPRIAMAAAALLLLGVICRDTVFSRAP